MFNSLEHEIEQQHSSTYRFLFSRRGALMSPPLCVFVSVHSSHFFTKTKYHFCIHTYNTSKWKNKQNFYDSVSFQLWVFNFLYHWVHFRYINMFWGQSVTISHYFTEFQVALKCIMPTCIFMFFVKQSLI